ncbi:unnamed protein product [Arctia plantaginis]|uniref:Uncharacterized protein n=1 Tax=Arctia plantaginis TaxID=874455 RepID=A0A8S1B3A5_ARCPL|nr:unnamed protein product [Arctia plantaginis]
MKVELGKEPKDIFLHDPTFYGHLFRKFKWEPVQRSITVHKTKIVDIIKEDLIIKKHEFINNSTSVVKSNRCIYEMVENTAQSLWSEGGIAEDEIFYHVDFNFTYGHFKYKNKWRSNKTHGARMSFGLTKKRNSIFIKPNETVVTDLIATKMIMIIEVEYKTELIGSAVANYAKLYGTYHFWAPSIRSIMKAANMKNELLTTEEIEVRCFVNPRSQEVVKPAHDVYSSGFKRTGMRKQKRKFE